MIVFYKMYSILINCEWIANELRMDCKLIAGELWLNRECIAKGLRMDCEWIANRLQIDCEWIAIELRVHCEGIANELRLNHNKTLIQLQKTRWTSRPFRTNYKGKTVRNKLMKWIVNQVWRLKSLTNDKCHMLLQVNKICWQLIVINQSHFLNRREKVWQWILENQAINNFHSNFVKDCKYFCFQAEIFF